VLNFLEGSRFTRAKHATGDSRFQNLLNPKLGGASYVVDALKDRLAAVVDVTITYPAGVPTFWDLLQGRCPEVRVLVRCHELPAEVRSAADSDAVRALLKPWIEGLWQEKDKRLTLERLAN
jgi:precorrin isomerase